MPNSTDLLTTQAYAKKIGVSASTVSQWLRSGKLKGQKKGGKWLIPADQKASGIDAATPAQKTTKPSVVTKKTPSTPQKETSGHRSYSLEEFSAMTYLTDFGVLKWLKEGRLKGSKDASGQWRVDAASLEDNHVRRLLR